MAVPSAPSHCDRFGPRSDDRVPRPEDPQVRRPDVRHDDRVGPRHVAEQPDVPLPARAHLGHHDLDTGFGAEQRHREPDLVVERRGAGVGPKARADHRGGEILGRGLAVRARDRDDAGAGHAVAFVGREVEQRPAGSRNLDHGPVDPRSMHERGHRPARERILDERVTVRALPFDRDEQAARRDRAGVRLHRRHDGVRSAERPANGGRDLGERAFDHGAVPSGRVAFPIDRSSSAATARSSNGIVRSASSW